MQYLSVCSGIEAATVAWHPLGWKPLAFSEIEAFPCAVLAHHYPDVPCHGDFTVLRDHAWIMQADVLVGGTPCQAFSVAGLRNSLADDRGNLTLEFVRLADAIDDLRLLAGREPAVIVWENVPGVLSVKDNAFGCFLAGLAGDVAPYVPPRGKWTNAGVVAGPQRTVAWRILDAQYFGLAQRRRRVFVVASARDGFDPAAVLLEFEGVRRDTPPRREKGQGVAGTIEASLGRSRGAGTPPGALSHWDGVEHPHPTLNQSAKGSGGVGASNQELFSQRGAYLVGDVTTARLVAFGEYSDDGTASTLKSRDYKDATDLVTHSLRGEGFDASEDGTGRGTPLIPTTYSIMTQNSGKDYKAREVEVAQPIMAGGPVGGNQGGDYILQPVSFYANEGTHGSGNNEDISVTLKAHPKTSNLAAVAYEQPVLSNDPAHAICANEQRTYTNEGSMFQLRNVVGQPVAFSYKDSGNDASTDLSPTLRSLGAYNANGGGQMAVAIPVQEVGKRTGVSTDDPRAGIGIGQDGDPMYTLQAGAQHGVATGKGDAAPCVAYSETAQTITAGFEFDYNDEKKAATHLVGKHHPHMAVRRLTPVECERLQGFPDNYTAIPWKKKPASDCPDGPRYKALGNSMAVPVMRWIGRRIAAHLAALREAA